MRKSVLLACAATSLALAGCNEAAEEAAPEAAATEEVAVEEAVALAADGLPAVGTYQVTKSDGSVNTYVANADGTFLWTGADGTTETGTWRLDGPNRWCDTAEGEEEECFTEAVDANGVYTSTSESDPADVGTIVRVVDGA